MSARAMSRPDASLLVDPELQGRLARIAEVAGRTVSELVSAVLRDFVEENERQLAAIDAGIAAADAGDVLDYEDVKAGIQKKLAALSAK